MLRLSVLVVVLVPLATSEESFHGHQVLRVRAPSSRQVDALRNLQESNHELDFWKDPVPNASEVHLRVSPEQANDVVTYFHKHGISHEVMLGDVQKAIDFQKIPHRFECRIGSATGLLTEYERTAPSYELMRTLSSRFPNITRVVSIGRSTGGVEIVGIEIDIDSSVRKPGYFIDGGIHAREWISPATVKNIAIALLEGYAGNDAQAVQMLTQFKWTIVPVVNPDGYEYTWTNSRLWRKTRSTNPGSSCVGTDPNRNSDISWTGSGSSSNPCSDVYRGRAPFSEPEVKAIFDYVLAQGNIRAYWNVHSYGQDLFIPYGYTNTAPPDRSRHQAAANAFAEAVRATTGARYSPRPDLSTVSGDLSDCIYANTTATYAGVAELRDTGRYGFTLPASEICPTSQEVFAGLFAHANFVFNNL